MRGDEPFIYHYLVRGVGYPVRKHWKRVAVAVLVVVGYAALSAF